MHTPERPRLSNVLALALIAVLASACSDQGEALSDAERGESQGTVFKLETGGGEGFQAEVGERVKLPADFPRDVPLYPGATPQGAFASPEDGLVVNLRSQDSIDEAYEFYALELEAEDWEIRGEVTLGGRRMLTAVKGARQAMITLAVEGEGEGEETVIVIVLTEER
jgi:hypothetical protein